MDDSSDLDWSWIGDSALIMRPQCDVAAKIARVHRDIANLVPRTVTGVSLCTDPGTLHLVLGTNSERSNALLRHDWLLRDNFPLVYMSWHGKAGGGEDIKPWWWVDPTDLQASVLLSSYVLPWHQPPGPDLALNSDLMLWHKTSTESSVRALTARERDGKRQPIWKLLPPPSLWLWEQLGILTQRQSHRKNRFAPCENHMEGLRTGLSHEVQELGLPGVLGARFSG